MLSLSLSPHHAFHLISGPGCQASDFWVEICQECSLQEEIRNLLFQSISSGKSTLLILLLSLTALSACWRKPHKSNQDEEVFPLFALVFGLLLLSLVDWNLGQFAEEQKDENSIKFKFKVSLNRPPLRQASKLSCLKGFKWPFTDQSLLKYSCWSCKAF